MAEIISTVSQMVSAFKKHYKISSPVGSTQEHSHLLLLFYAVECGLKAKYLREYNALNTSAFNALPVGKKYGHGHNIWEWVKALKLPDNGFMDDKNVPILQMHEKLRYGTFSTGTIGNKQITFLKYLASILNKGL